MARVISVAALNGYVRAKLESDDALCGLAVRGEVSNFTNHYKTGHFYFSLKDESSAVKAVMFRRYAERLAFQPENGMRVIVLCRVSLFERDGAYQIYVEDIIPDGVGAIQAAVEQLKARLNAEGLFAAEHKRPLPAAPRCVGLVTSGTGAALQDILQVTRRRCPTARFLLAGVTVQGKDAAPEIANAIARLGGSGRVDVVVVARGGGSREDLWVFNDERIARAAYACRVPVVSAIGHEIDFSILDLVADVRAPTPSAAAELVMPDLGEKLRVCRRTMAGIENAMRGRLQACRAELRRRADAPQLGAVRGRPRAERDALRQKAADIRDAARGGTGRAAQRLRHMAALCESLNPYGVLARGYSITRSGGAVLKSAKDVRPGDAVEVRLAGGVLGCTVQTVELSKAEVST